MGIRRKPDAEVAPPRGGLSPEQVRCGALLLTLGPAVAGFNEPGPCEPSAHSAHRLDLSAAGVVAGILCGELGEGDPGR